MNIRTPGRMGALLVCIGLFLLLTQQSLATNEQPPLVPISENRIIKVEENGIAPNPLEMKVSDSIIFVLNGTRDALLTLEVEYGDKMMHCTSKNLKMTEDGRIVSVKPFGPKGFASMCFHQAGTYPVTVYGVPGFSQGLKTEVRVSPDEQGAS